MDQQNQDKDIDQFSRTYLNYKNSFNQYCKTFSKQTSQYQVNLKVHANGQC